MFKKILGGILGGCVGFTEGFILGPFAAAGKWLSMCEEEALMRDEYRRSGKWSSGQGKGSASGTLIGVIVFFVAGLVYGPILGAILGIQQGLEDLNKNIFYSIAKEMFSYEPFYDDTIKIETIRANRKTAENHNQISPRHYSGNYQSNISNNAPKSEYATATRKTSKFFKPDNANDTNNNNSSENLTSYTYR